MIEYVTNHYGDICAAVAAALLLAHAVVKFTPSKKDDEIVDKIDSVLSGFLQKKQDAAKQ